ncbi:two-component system VirA-like sensor kinase [Rhizobium sp. 0TCS1.26]|uniref:two-component system VirA-like sensor kinase n=1 Tax=Rhizobium sp. 0TCS1.26 TaxID=3142623 RepID=UPI003D284A97
MVKGSKRRPLKVVGEAWLIALAVMFAISLAVIAAGRDPGQSTHEKITRTLREVDLSHASLQRDVLRVRAGLIRSYDPLVNSVVALRAITAKLNDLLLATKLDDQERLARLLQELQKSIDADEQLVEQFKTRNALLQNSIGVFGQTLTTLHQSRNPAVRTGLAAVSDLGNLMMRFATKPEAELVPTIRADLTYIRHMAVPAADSREIQTLVTHAEMILAILPVVDEKIAAVQASGTPARAQQLQALYLDIYGAVNSNGAWSRMLLGATAISLCLYVFVLVYRLRNQTERLKNRLEYESCITLIKTMMVNASPRDFPDLMEQALGMLAGFFDADACGFVILNGDTGEVKDHYRLRGQQDEYVALLADFARDLLMNADAQPQDDPWFPTHRNLLKTDDLAYTRDDTSSGIVVGRKLPDRSAATLLFLFDAPRPKLAADDIGLMQTTVQVLIELIDSKQSRQEKEALENRLEHSQRLEAVGTLAGGIAHEFNNVLGAILGYGEMALQMLRKPSPTRQYVQEILTSAERAKHIVDQILTFSRKRERARKPFDVVEAISDILPLLQVTLGNQIALTARLPEKPAVIEGNPIEIHQIAMNLCKNAMEASVRGQEVEMEVSQVQVRRRRTLSHGEILSGFYVCLAVQDHGDGIPKSLLPHIFEPFFTTKAQSGGTGLGLSAVHGSVSGMDGSINVQSISGSGTRFELFFPASLRPPVPVKSFFNEGSVPTGIGQTVAIVEKDKALLDMYEEKIAALGYEPVGYGSLDALLRILEPEEIQPDLVVVDSSCIDPSMSIMQLEAVLSGLRYLVLADRNRAANLDDCPLLSACALNKPFSSQSLAQAIFHRINLA